MAQASDGLRLRGQSELLTRRLKRLLDEYSDGLAVPKELLQNADDAGATEVTLLYDCRENSDWRGSESLLDPAMADCQGRALWAFNNATFSDEDFDNILQLSGATKLEKTAKVGRFGLGFNSVYNLTDVPQILSRHRMLILDPHGERRGEGYLEAVYASHGDRDTGVELDFQAQPSLLDRYANQFAPFAGVSGCNLQADEGNFAGTLLRLPLRTEAQAAKSKICDRVYSDSEIGGLLRLAAEQADTMLLFTQTVRTFRCLFLPSNATDPSNQTQLVFCVHKSPLKYFQRHAIALPPLPISGMSQADQEFAAQSSILKVAEALIESATQGGSGRNQAHRCQATVEVEVQLGDSAHDQFQISTVASTRVWLVCAAVATGQSLAVALEQRRLGLAPVGAVALPIEQSHRIVPLSRDTQPASLLFCFLPLPVENPFPVMLNASFSVTSSRRHLNEVTVDEKQGVWSLGEWNRVLLTDVICPAYIDALKILSGMSLVNAEISQELWPRFDRATHSVWRPLIEKFYASLLDGQAPIFHTSASWKSFGHTVFLDPSILSLGGISDCLSRLATRLVGQHEGVASLTDGVRRTVEQLGLTNKILQHQWSAETLLVILVTNMSRLWKSGYSEDCFGALKFILDEICQDERRELKSASKTVTEMVNNALKKYCCIPNANNALCKPSEILDQKCLAARLFDSEDPIFPHSDLRTEDRLKALRLIGMRNDLLWAEVMRRAASLTVLAEPHREERTKVLLSYLGSLLNRKFRHPFEQLKSVEFLPAMRKPQDCCFNWQSDKYLPGALFQPDKLYTPNCKDLVSASQLVIDESLFSEVEKSVRIELMKSIGVLNNVTRLVTWQQLVTVINTRQTNEETLRVSQCVYRYFSRKLSEKGITQPDVTNLIKQVPNVIWSPHGFRRPTQVSMWKLDTDFPPFLFKLSPELIDEAFMLFFKAAGVLTKFKTKHFVWALGNLAQQRASTRLSDDDLELSLGLLYKIVNSTEKFQHKNELLAPDKTGVLRPCSQLCFNNIPWMDIVQLADGTYFCHQTLSFDLCEKLGIRSQRESMISQAMRPLPFGQHEDLTTRLKSILAGYPFGSELFKELIQNADDAGASTISFIIDHRHHGTERVLSDNWKELQGPALLVYNDSTFSDADIEGIQDLGVGSKRDELWKAGNYGIGFNCVYNITDAPSFLSDGKVLCVMDPHCKYMPGATAATPGGMFKELENLKDTFTDVFAGYLPEHLQQKGGTVFRLPLRFSNQSKICQKVVDANEIKTLFDEQLAKEELEQAVLFLVNVKEVKLGEVSQDGVLNTLYTVRVQADRLPDSKEGLDDFKNKCEVASQSLMTKGISFQSAQ
ncbi:hypothetical protein BOX15_Mlig004621g1 [Macrostomum lignano]|uniref:Sacsin/Nov domain-containing protein n=1 Tax=Macrostomum lignano TaxID=282301 RepID=A0A267FC05_9PLAT|nr:hypothetical protein BOX15_Mlig004621g1 [Macrostomum lignano]